MEMALAASPLSPPYCPAASPEPTLPSLGKLPCPCLPCLALSVGIEAAAEFESLVSLPIFGDTWVLISCPGIHPSSICPVLMAAHAPVSYLSASCSQERAGGQTSDGLSASISGRGRVALIPSSCWFSSCSPKCPCLAQRCLLKPGEESASTTGAEGC